MVAQQTNEQSLGSVAKDAATDVITDQLTDYVWDFGKNALGFGTPTGALGGAYGPTAGMAGGNPGLAAVTAGPGIGTMLAGGAFAAFAGFIASKIFSAFTSGNPSLTFYGNEVTEVPIEQYNDRGERLTTTRRQLDPGAYKSEKFGFNIGVNDIEGGTEIAQEVGQYLDHAFTQMQGATSVDISQIVNKAMNLSDFQGNGAEAVNEMMQDVIASVGNGITTGEVMTPYYSQSKTPGGGNKGLFTGIENFNNTQQGGVDRGEFVNNTNSPLTGRDQFNTTPDTRATYTQIDNIQGDPNFVMPDLGFEDPGTTGTTGTEGVVQPAPTGVTVPPRSTLQNLAFNGQQPPANVLTQQQQVPFDQASLVAQASQYQPGAQPVNVPERNTLNQLALGGR